MGAGLNKVRNRIGYITKVAYKNLLKNDLYIRFTKKTKEEVSYEEYKAILKASNAEIGNIILSNELGFKVPNNLGYIAVSKFLQKSDYIVPDWKHSVMYKKYIPHLNLHSFGYMFRIRMFKNKKMVPFKVYFMHAHRGLKRELATRIKAGQQNYLSLDDSYFNKRFSIDNIFKSNK